ncbi:MAG TPA: molybdopterin-dependent oxidoreductase [Dehalococcoidia bacterium]|nr:molybdopterin-dependent oxidoreductase [Dehalococcoidia bacterium]
MNRTAILADLWPPLLGGLVAIAGALLLRTLSGTRLLAEISLDAMLSILPGENFSSLLGVFGPYGKALFFFSALLAQLAVYVIVWMRVRRYAGVGAGTARVAIGAGLAIVLLLLLIAVVLISITTATLGQYTGWLDFAFATVLFSAIYASVAGLQSLGGLSDTEGTVESASRRRFLTRIPGVALAGLAIIVIGRAIDDASGGGVQRSRSGQASPEVTPTDEFYIISKNLIDPEPNGSTWRLQVGGATERVLKLDYEDMLAMPSQEQYTTMQCISNEVGGELIGNALWRGVPLSTVIGQAGVLPTANHVFLRCADDYTDSIPLEFAMRPQTLLAYQMNGEKLSSKHGFPLRLLTPGKYGMKHPKWIIEIILLEDEQLGFWQQRGWSQEASMNTTVRIDVPGASMTVTPDDLLVQGVAFSGDRGISKVEISTDGGSSWDEAKLKPPLSPYTWILWEYEWHNPPLGEGALLARATDGTGQLQKPDSVDPYPDGAAAYHRVPFRVESGSA